MTASPFDAHHPRVRFILPTGTIAVPRVSALTKAPSAPLTQTTTNMAFGGSLGHVLQSVASDYSLNCLRVLFLSIVPSLWPTTTSELPTAHDLGRFDLLAGLRSRNRLVWLEPRYLIHGKAKRITPYQLGTIIAQTECEIRVLIGPK